MNSSKLIFLIFSLNCAVSASLNNLDEDTYLTVPELIKKYGYPCEEHQVTTIDGYILTLHRIPYGRSSASRQSSSKVILLQHGLLSSSADFIITGVKNALGYILADSGYDVWMGNSRGNTYSRNHTDLNPDTSAEFWQFSWHEMGIIDLPTTIDYILEQTGVPDLIYVGHSQGTTSFYVMASTLPEYNEKIRAQFSLAPIAFMNHMTSPLLRTVAYWTGPLDFITSLIGLNEFLPHTELVTKVGNLLCSDNNPTQPVCTNILFLLFGFSYEEMNDTMIGVISGHTPAGSSSKQLVHYGQEIVSGHFRQYNFGVKNNMIKYGTKVPPDYNLSAISTPVYLMYSVNDWMAAVVDVFRLKDNLGNCAGIYEIPDKKFNHLDFLYGVHAPEFVYNQLLNWIDQYYNDVYHR